MSLIATELRQRLPQTPDAQPATPLRAAAASFWLDAMFRSVGSAPLIARLLRTLAIDVVYRCSRSVRSATAANALRILGPGASLAEQNGFGRRVIANFFDFVFDVGQSLHLNREQLAARIESVVGHEHYAAARAMGKGAIIATAHMGSFEAAAAALLDHEKAVHVVFKRDATRFEQVRSLLRRKLGVIEAPVDDGWGLWMRLRDALLRDEVVMMQCDRVMPGQKGRVVPFLHGHLLLPTGPVKLALASGAPIIPIFALRAGGDRIRICVEPAITVLDADAALGQLAEVLEKYVRAWPDQWLLFHKAFCEDAP